MYASLNRNHYDDGVVAYLCCRKKEHKARVWSVNVGVNLPTASLSFALSIHNTDHPRCCLSASASTKLNRQEWGTRSLESRTAHPPGSLLWPSCHSLCRLPGVAFRSFSLQECWGWVGFLAARKAISLYQHSIFDNSHLPFFLLLLAPPPPPPSVSAVRCAGNLDG